jgi:hypothetical protein
MLYWTLSKNLRQVFYFDAVKEISKPTTKSGSALTSLAGLPSLTGGRSLLPLPQPKENDSKVPTPLEKSLGAKAKEAVPQPKESDSKVPTEKPLVAKAKEEGLPREPEISKYLKKSPEASNSDAHAPNSKPSQSTSNTNLPVSVPVVSVKTAGLGKELIDDVSEEILDEIDAAADEEDEEFTKMLAKAKEIKRNSSAAVSVVPVVPVAPLVHASAPSNDNKGPSDKKPESLLFSSSLSKSVEVKNETPKPTAVLAKVKPVEPVVPINKKIEHDYEEDFEVGHTDEEIVFSDDGLSLSGSKSDDAF